MSCGPRGISRGRTRSTSRMSTASNALLLTERPEKEAPYICHTSAGTWSRGVMKPPCLTV